MTTINTIASILSISASILRIWDKTVNQLAAVSVGFGPTPKTTLAQKLMLRGPTPEQIRHSICKMEAIPGIVKSWEPEARAICAELNAELDVPAELQKALYEQHETRMLVLKKCLDVAVRGEFVKNNPLKLFAQSIEIGIDSALKSAPAKSQPPFTGGLDLGFEIKLRPLTDADVNNILLSALGMSTGESN